MTGNIVFNKYFLYILLAIGNNNIEASAGVMPSHFRNF